MTTAPPAVAQAREDVFVRLGACGVSEGVWQRLVDVEVDWLRLQGWLRARSWTGKDVAALVSLRGMGLDMDEIEAWHRLGGLDAGLRLALKGVSPELVHRFPLAGGQGSEAVLRMVQASANTGMHIEDLVWWHTAGVLSLSRPYLDRVRWARWRAVGATRMGMRRAALAAAAGLTPEAAVAAVESGEYNAPALEMLAGLRAGPQIF